VKLTQKIASLCFY